MEEKEQKNENNDKPKSPAANKFRKVNIEKKGSFRSFFQNLKITKSFKNDLPRKLDKPIHSSPSSPRPGTSRKNFERYASSSPNSPKSTLRSNTQKVTFTDSSKSQEPSKIENDSAQSTTRKDAGVFKPPDYVKLPVDRDSKIESPIDVETTTEVEQHATEYKMDYKRRGKCIVLNHENFEKEDKRAGTEKDVQAISEIFGKLLGFEIKIYDDLECTDIMNLLNHLSQQDYSDCDSFVMFILTHGRNKGEISAKDMYYPVEKLWQPFTANKCISLAGKPKLFFINACRGEKKDHGIKFTFNRRRTEADSGRRDGYKVPTHADFLIAQSSVEGFFSYRDPTSGTWFIQALCEAFREHHETHDLLKILTITSRKVAVSMTTQSENAADAELTQIPSFTSMLIREVYFRSKIKKDSENISTEPNNSVENTT